MLFYISNDRQCHPYRVFLQESLANAKVSARQRRCSGAAWWIVIQYMAPYTRKISEKIWTYSSSRSSKVDDFGTNRKCICHFLLVINSNFGPILHRFWDTATYWLKIAHFSYRSLIRRRRSLSSLSNFTARLSVRKLESWSYSVMKVAWS